VLVFKKKMLCVSLKRMKIIKKIIFMTEIVCFYIELILDSTIREYIMFFVIHKMIKLFWEDRM
jgi:hypothetical protein